MLFMALAKILGVLSKKFYVNFALFFKKNSLMKVLSLSIASSLCKKIFKNFYHSKTAKTDD